MPTFTNAPPEPDGERALQLKRAPATGSLKAAITCQDLIGCNTHFYGGHTVPCEAPDCEACGKGIPWRWHGYVSAIQSQTRQHFLYEFTAQAGDVLREYFELHKTLRGCVFVAERMHHRPNGRVILQVKPGDLAGMNLPESPDLEACLRIIWHLPKEGNDTLSDRNHKQLINIAAEERMAQDLIGSQTSSRKKVG